MAEDTATDLGPDRSLLLVDDDEIFVKPLAKAMEKHGFLPETAESVQAGRAIALARPPAYAVVDLRLGDGKGLEVVETLQARRPDCRVVVLTGYGAIAAAVAAVKIGAIDYLAQPADANDIMNALLARAFAQPPLPDHLRSADRVRWEHIQRVHEICGPMFRKPRAFCPCTGGPCKDFLPDSAKDIWPRWSDYLDFSGCRS